MILYIFSEKLQFYKKKNTNKKGSWLLFLFLSFGICSRSLGQIPFIEKEQHKIDSTLLLYQQKDKYKFLNLLPSVNYDALNNSFNVGFSLTGLANYYQQKRRNQIELAKLENSLSERLENKIEKLDLEKAAIKAALNSLENEALVFEIDVQLYEISKGKYKNAEITTEDFLKLKKVYLTRKNSLKNKLSKLLLKAKKIELKSKNDFLSKPVLALTAVINGYD
jgi:hypothetical protein